MGSPARSTHPIADGGTALSIHLLAVSLLSRFAHRAGLVIVRQTFVHRSHPGASLAVARRCASNDATSTVATKIRWCLGRALIAFLQWHAGGATQRERPRAPCAI